MTLESTMRMCGTLKRGLTAKFGGLAERATSNCLIFYEARALPHTHKRKYTN
ncbi:unnamed protein product [Strongylus vulgaris]|uniref:Uncharacterized protein n=1 Tax=Strongylus vulgaris TaxID=40348 RepID=A0A3P7JEG3_STRVU|nr:unnamed protein product [Strongylus vulgaris]